MRSWIWGVFVIVTLAGVLSATHSWSDPPAKPRTTHEMMREKLAIAQQLLRAVATEDYETTERQANQLAQLTRDAAWQVFRTNQYRQESVEFERAAYLLAEAARQKKMGETTLGFLGITLSCIKCHRYLRESDEIELRAITVPALAEVPESKQSENFWMDRKLELSESILAALAVGDAASVEKNAQTMQRLSTIEGWSRRKDAAEYREHLDYFRAANKALIAHAQANDLDGASLAFTQVTLSCVKCHHHLRKADQPTPAETPTQPKK